MFHQHKTNAGGCWYKSKLHKDKDLCTRCYEKERRDRLQANGDLKCWCCGAMTTSAKWRTSKDKSEGKKDLCNKCYLRNAEQRRRQWKLVSHAACAGRKFPRRGSKARCRKARMVRPIFAFSAIEESPDKRRWSKFVN